MALFCVSRFVFPAVYVPSSVSPVWDRGSGGAPCAVLLTPVASDLSAATLLGYANTSVAYFDPARHVMDATKGDYLPIAACAVASELYRTG